MKKKSPFEIVTNINKGISDFDSTQYVPHIINKAFSGWSDTLLYANQMNMYPDLNSDIQHDYYNASIRTKFRKNNWIKKQKEDENLIEIQNKYNINQKIAKQYKELENLK